MIVKALLVTACGATRLIDWVETENAIRDVIVTTLTPSARPYYQPSIAAPLPEDMTLATRRFRWIDEIRLPYGPMIHVYLEERR